MPPYPTDTTVPYVECPGDISSGRIAGESLVEEAAYTQISGPEATLFGFAVAGVGDVTGDGLPDLAVIDPYERVGDDSGAAFLLRGPIPPLFADPHLVGTMLVTNPDNGVIDQWIPAAYGSMTALPDVTGDGIAELVLGNSYSGAGAVWVVASPVGPAGAALELSSEAWATYTYVYQALRFGHAMAVGDVDGDQVEELVVSAPYFQPDGTFYQGQGYIFRGPQQPGIHDDEDAVAKIVAETAVTDAVGLPLIMGEQVLAVDLDADGVSEVMVTSPDSWVEGYYDRRGFVYVWQGPILGDVSTADATAEYAGAEDDALLGEFANVHGDMDGDGYPEFGLSSKPHLEFTGDSHVWVVNGLVPGELAIDAVAITDLLGPAEGMLSASAGDLDEDGTPDAAMGTSVVGEEEDRSGGVYVFYGPLPVGSLPVAQCADALVRGSGQYNNPTAIAGPGDLTGDGNPDLVIGQRVGDVVYIVPGGAL